MTHWILGANMSLFSILAQQGKVFFLTPEYHPRSFAVKMGRGTEVDRTFPQALHFGTALAFYLLSLQNQQFARLPASFRNTVPVVR